MSSKICLMMADQTMKKMTITNKAGSHILTNHIFPVNDFIQMKEKVLNWAQQFNTFSFLDNHGYQIKPHTQECILAAGVKRYISAHSGDALSQLQLFIDEKKAWYFGHLSYDLKNELEPLSSGHPDHIGFPDLFFFEPEYIIQLNETGMEITGENPQQVFDVISKTGNPSLREINTNSSVQSRLSREEYISTIEQLRWHILRGDCYEINFCQEFFIEHATIDPLVLYKQLTAVSPNPFSALYRVDDKWLLCASPERFLKNDAGTLLSQPIKGTSKRAPTDEKKDLETRDALQHSDKDRSENVMIVDLVRNDLAKICEEGSVKVDELYGIYSFPQVHQMISTISGRLKKDTCFSDIMRATFPMGSMTGAPKRKVMELIEKYEKTKRGIFSGAVGYIAPSGDFDFNVVIRSLMYNAATHYLSFQAGSGITFYSDPANEWEECMMKAEAMIQVLSPGS